MLKYLIVSGFLILTGWLNLYASLNYSVPEGVANKGKATAGPDFVVPGDTTICRAYDCSYDASPTITGIPTSVTTDCLTGHETASYTDNISNLMGCSLPGYIIRTWTVIDDCGLSVDKNQIINVNPLPIVTSSTFIETCNNLPLSYSATSTVSGAGFRWKRDAVAGISNPAATGTTGEITEILNNTSSDPVYVNYIITPSYALCDGIPFSVTVKVNPTAAITSPLTASWCSDVLNTYSIASSANFASFTWSRAKVTGIYNDAFSGSGALISETLTNTTPGPVNVQYIITASVNGCVNDPDTLTVTVNPVPQLNVPPDLTLCSGDNYSMVFTSLNTGGVTIFKWTNSLSTINLPASGTGNISFTAISSEKNPVTADINVTPYFINGSDTCAGTQVHFGITVNPAVIFTVPASFTLCNGDQTGLLDFNSDITGGTTFYTWINHNTSIGLPAASGTGNIASFITTNSGNSPIIDTIGVTAHFVNKTDTCNGLTKIVTITVNPDVIFTVPANMILCSGDTTGNLIFNSGNSGGVTSFLWKNKNTSIGLGSSVGSGNINSFTTINTGASPVTDTIEVTGNFNGCYGTTKIFTITVNPLGEVQPVSNQVLCNGESTLPVSFQTINTGGTTIYSWENSNPLIGLTANGTGNTIPSFHAINNSYKPVIAEIRVTPHFNSSALTCDGPSKLFTITVNPTAQVNQPDNLVVCYGSDVSNAVSFSTLDSIGLTTYSWRITNNADIGLSPASGTTSYLPEFTAKNPGTSPLTASLEVIPHFFYNNQQCDGPSKSFTITVNPVAQVNVVNYVVCNGDKINTISFSTDNSVGITSYLWILNNNAKIGLPATSGIDSIPGFIALNSGFSPIVASITVTPYFTYNSVTCSGNSKTFTIIVNPTPQVIKPDDQIICNGSYTYPVYFASSNTNTQIYSWTNSNPSIGLAAKGQGLSIEAFQAVNNGTSPIEATIIVTPRISNGLDTCDGPAANFKLIVNPEPQANMPANMVLCNGDKSGIIVFSSNNTGGTSGYLWNFKQYIGQLNSFGDNDTIPSFQVKNQGVAPIVAGIQVTPYFINANGGSACYNFNPNSFTITVNPDADVIKPANQVVCNGDNTTTVKFSTNNTSGTTTYIWKNHNTSIIVTPGTTGTGDFVSYKAVNTGTFPLIDTIEVTPAFTNGAVSCPGLTKMFTITVNPTAEADQPGNQILCNGSYTTLVKFTTQNSGGTPKYSWKNYKPSIVLTPGSIGTDDFGSFKALNTGTYPLIDTIEVIPYFTYGSVTCSGPSKFFTITVNPTAQVDIPSNQVLCNGVPTNLVKFLTHNTGGITTYNWTHTNLTLGLPASGGTGDIPSFITVNGDTKPLVDTITVTPYFSNGSVTCSGQSVTFTITVNPVPAVDQPINLVYCNGKATDMVTFGTVNTGGTTTYSWINDQTSIGLSAGSSGDIQSFIAVNTGTKPVIATITVVPYFTNEFVTCQGPSKTFTITVNPTPQFVVPNDTTLCNNTTSLPMKFQSLNSGGSDYYSWVNTLPSIGIPATGNGTILSFTALNGGDKYITDTVFVTPNFTNASLTCVGSVEKFAINVNPTPRALITNLKTEICFGENTNVNLGSPTLSLPDTSQVHFNYTVSATGNPGDITGSMSPGSGSNITGTYYNNSSSVQSVFYTVIPMNSVCGNGPPVSTEVKVHPRTIQFSYPGTDSVPSVRGGGVLITKSLTCEGGSDASIKVFTSTGAGPYYYDWIRTSSDQIHAYDSSEIKNHKGGRWDVTVTDALGCKNSTYQWVEGSSFTTLYYAYRDPLTGLSVTCPGGNDGRILIMESGTSTVPVSYSVHMIENPSIVISGTIAIKGTVYTIPGLTAGSYALYLTDAKGCSNVNYVHPDPPVEIVNQPDSIKFQFRSHNETCKSSDGSIKITTVTGGNGSFTFTWFHDKGRTNQFAGQTTDSLPGLAAGVYYINISDLKNCVKKDSIVVNPPEPLKFTISPDDFNGVNISCNGKSDGQITINTLSGKGPFHYSLLKPDGNTVGSDLPVFSGLVAGKYKVMVNDGDFCITSDTITLTQPGKLGLIINLPFSKGGKYNINCNGGNGTVNLEPVNQVKTVTYYWPSDSLTGPSKDLPAGNYIVSIKDLNNCRASDKFTLTEPDSLKVTFDNIKLPYCPDKPDGSVQAKAQGGEIIVDYTYKWSDNSTVGTLTDVAAGKYTVTVTDANDCSVSNSLDMLPLHNTCLVIPNAISPNGDLVNDVWNIGQIDLYPLTEVKIFNRLGQLVWKSGTGYAQPWDGTSNGTPLPIDSYHYIIDLHNGSRPLIGNVTILK